MCGVKFLATLVIFSSTSIAEISIGADITSYFSGNNEKTELSTTSTRERHTNYTTIGLGPQIGIFPSKVVEVAPFIRWSITTSSSENTTIGETTTSTTKSEGSQHFLEPGCGAYFHVVNNNTMLDFSIGPKLSYSWAFTPHSKNESGTSTSTEYDKYYNGSLNLGVQTNIDLKFTEHFKARFYSNLFRLSLSNTHTKYKNATTESRTANILSDFKTILQPSFGFHFTF